MAKKTPTAYFYSFSFLCLLIVCLFVCLFVCFIFLPSQRANIDEEKLRSFGATKLHRGVLYYFSDRIDNHVE